MKLHIKLLLSIVAAMLLAGCATSRSVVAVQAAPSYQSANPADGTAIKLVTTDLRKFELAPATPDIPSLKNGEITNTAITSRAIARKRNGYGKALGDVLLPEGQTVATTVESAVAAGFREAGYRVLRPGDPGFEDAVAVDAQINQYWSWVNIGFWALTLNCRSEVTLTAPLPGMETGLKVTALADKSAQAAFESVWQDIANQGLTELTRSVSRALPRRTAAF
ncbi:MAG: hypothetical protein Q8J92_06285 [Parvibaculum sp.]|nr:hypothetical protein [Parvibaculum sp.]